jgi:hypothetical protein
VPESKRRRRPARTSAAVRSQKKKGPSPVWLAPLMLVLFGIGILWIVVFYLSNQDLPIRAIGGGNALVGFGFIILGFVLSTQWR